MGSPVPATGRYRFSEPIFREKGFKERLQSLGRLRQENSKQNISPFPKHPTALHSQQEIQLDENLYTCTTSRIKDSLFNGK